MALALKPQAKLQPQITAQLTQTMAFLELPAVDLEAQLAAELAHNPALELVPAGRCLNCGRPLRKDHCSICQATEASSALIVRVVDRPSFSGDDRQREEPELCAPETLPEYVLRQVAVAVDDIERSIAVYLLAQLDDRGFLREPPAQIAADLQLPVERVLAVLRLIQHVDPPGIGACTVQECLLLQLESLNAEGHGHALASTLIADYWDLLSANRIRQAAHALHVSQGEVSSALDFIRHNLTPYPAQVYWNSRRVSAAPPHLVPQQPDAVIYRSPAGATQPLIVEIVSPASGWLQVNAALKAALKQCDPEERERLRSSIERAQLIARCVQQRNQTMRRVLEVIVQEQTPYLLGNEPQPRPLKRAHLARQLDLHESTVSRAVGNKTIALPDGRVVLLAYFFDQSVAVRAAVQAIIDDELQPLSDDQIAQRLAAQGLRVARRTVSKYRTLKRIPASSQRA